MVHGWHRLHVYQAGGAIMNRATYRQHDCGGVIGQHRHDDADGTPYQHCDSCGAYGPTGEDLPTGTDEVANQKAFDDCEDQSPDCDEAVQS